MHPTSYNLSKAPQGRWYNITNNAAAHHVDIYLYGVIGGYYANVQQFLADLQAAGKVDTITVYLNTVGGSFYDGLPIYNTLKQHKAHVTVKVMGYALSMGSVIMLAGNVVEAAENSLIMIHRAQGAVWGDADDMAHAATVLQKHEQAIMPEYVRRLGKSEQVVQQLLKAETWYTAAEAKAAGLVDAITGDTTADPSTARLHADSWEYAAQHYRNIPQTLLNRLNQSEGNDTMKAEDIQAITTAVVQAMQASNPDSVSKRKYDELEADYKQLKSHNLELEVQLSDANAKIAEQQALLDETDPGTVPPINHQPAGMHLRGGGFYG